MVTFAGSFQVSPLTGICTNPNRIREQRRMCGRLEDGVRISKLNVASTSLLFRDSWSFHLSATMNRPMGIFPYRYKAFKCSVLPGLGGNAPISSVTAATDALARSIKVAQSNPFVSKSVPAVGILLFAIWGLAPVVRIIRNLFLQKNSSNWKKSTTCFLLTSYLQPILLWTGVTLICRALDPMLIPSEASQLVKQRLLTFVKSLATVLAIAYCLSGAILQAQKFFMETDDLTDARNMGFQFAGKAVYTAVWVAAAALFMELLGFSTQKWLTAGGLGTVLLTLAGREIFTNFLSSAMIHATRPFVVNEWIQTKIEGYDVSGTVEHVGWWSPTIIRGEDREAVHIPNHKFTVNVVRNLSQKSHWRIKTHLAISHLDVNKINNIVADMRKVLSKNPQVEQQRLHRRVFLENINPENQALMILISCFVKTSHFEEYLCVKEAILLDLLRVIRHHGARLATPIRTIEKAYINADTENGSSGFTRGTAFNRPSLLLEPPHKINGEDKTKGQSRSAPSNTDQDKQVSGQPISDSEVEAKINGTPMPELDLQEVSKFGSKAEPKVEKTLDSVLDGNSIAATPSASDKLSEKGTTNMFSSRTPFEKERGNADLSSSDSKVSGATSSVNHSSNVIAAATSASDPKLSEKGTANISSRHPPEKERMKADLSSSDAKVSATASSENQKSKLESPRTSSEVENPVLSQKKDEKSDASPPSKQPPAAQPPKPRPGLEDNIVLGVALEGSKRTLPIEEEPTPTPAAARSPVPASVTAPVATPLPASSPAEAKQGSGRPNAGVTPMTQKDVKGV
ncbi:hypothetical protein Drorol1_Dr00021920 [Drosera rotundifolia]